MVSTTDNNLDSFVDISGMMEAPLQWTKESFDLSEYDDQEIYVAVNYKGTDTFYFMVDNVRISTVSSTESVNAPNFAVYPNPSKGLVNVSNAKGANINVLNNLGQVVFSRENINEVESFDLSAFGSGSYIISVELNNTISKKHFVITK